MTISTPYSLIGGISQDKGPPVFPSSVRGDDTLVPVHAPSHYSIGSEERSIDQQPVRALGIRQV